MSESKLQKWSKELAEVLETRNVKKLIVFMNKWTKEGMYDEITVENFKKAPKRVQLGSMCKMIVHRTDVSFDTKLWAMQKLGELDMSPEII